MVTSKLLKECQTFYIKNIQEIKKSLTASTLCRIYNEDFFTIGSMHYSKLGVIYNIAHKEYNNYNFSITLHYHPGQDRLMAVNMMLKSYLFSGNYLSDNTDICKNHNSSAEKIKILAVITPRKISSIAKEVNCPYNNMFILPFFYVAKYNELDTLLSQLITHKRRTKHR